MKRYVMTFDQGTTSSRCILYDRMGMPVAVGQRELPQIYPKPGWVEHDPEMIWQTQMEAAKEAMQKASATADDIAAIGITNQRETTVVWDRISGKPICHAIVWQCRRTADLCEAMRRSGIDVNIRSKTGLVADAYFSLTKVRWILDHVEGAAELAKTGRLAFGTIDSWLIWKLTGGKRHVTDITNASRTMMFNIHTRTWDDDVLTQFDIPRALLPEVLPSSGFFGETDLFGGSIPICGVAGDQQASLFGQTCYGVGDVKNTYGTGCFLLMNTGRTAVSSGNGLITTVGWQLGDEVTYALEGSVFIAGAAIQWLRDGIGILAHSAESEAMACSIPDTGGVYFVPAFTGLGSPYWDPDARGLLCGLTRGTERAHIVRAALEAMAYQTDDVLKIMTADSGIPVTTLRVDGGASANGFLCQFQSDLSAVAVERPKNIETTSLGAAYLAGLGSGLYENCEEIAALHVSDAVFHSDMSLITRAALREGWQNAVKRCKGSIS